jgi:hypothetical protein
MSSEGPTKATGNRRGPAADQPAADARQKTSKVAEQRSRGLGKNGPPRDKEHRKFVTRQPCLVCGRVPSDPHHLTFTQPRALGHRVSDEFTVPVCRIHHRELHRSGNEAAWWQKLNIDPLPVALRLWQNTRADGDFAPISAGVMQAPAAKTPDMSRQDRAGTNHDQRADLQSAPSSPDGEW